MDRDEIWGQLETSVLKIKKAYFMNHIQQRKMGDCIISNMCHLGSVYIYAVILRLSNQGDIDGGLWMGAQSHIDNHIWMLY